VIASVGFSASRDAAAAREPFIELSFPVQGKLLPADHNYALYAALVNLEPDIRQQSDLSILSIPGFGDKQGKFCLQSNLT
jgi:CRISPR-associated endonuclease/helicase Cas3